MDEIRLYDLERRVKALEDQLHNRLWPKNHAPGTGISKSEAARMLGVSRATIYHMIEDGRLLVTHEGRRIDVDSVSASKRRYGLRES